MSSNNHSCKDCEKRFMGCHATCKDYLNFKEEHEKQKQFLKDKLSGYPTHTDGTYFGSITRRRKR